MDYVVSESAALEIKACAQRLITRALDYQRRNLESYWVMATIAAFMVGVAVGAVGV